VNTDSFRERLREAIGSQSVNAFAKKCGLSESVVRGYLRGPGLPSLDRAQALAAGAGVSLDWLASGNPQNSTQVPTAHPQGSAIILEALQDAIGLVEEWLKTNRREMDPAKKADVIAKLYQLFLEDISEGQKPLDKRRAQQFLRLVA